jgi:hypothetical protein
LTESTLAAFLAKGVIGRTKYATDPTRVIARNGGKKQIMYVKETWRDRYERKPWNKPLLIAFCVLVGTFIVLTAAN